ncbi:MAG: penicillin-binding transpeptidase domain-containing protein, partial [Clostridia bacterium]
MKTNIKARFWFIGGVIALVFLVLTVQLANLQIRNSDVYGEKAKSKRTKVITLKGDRGQIMDASGTLLAYDKKIYNIEFYREPSSGELQNAAYSRAIWEVIQLVEKSGGTVLSNLWLKQDEKGQWVFDFGDITKEAAAKREKMWRANFYLNGVEQQQLFDKLCKNYGINALDKEHTPLTTEDKRKILGVWQEMQMNAFLSKPVRIAANVEWATVIEIETRLISLDGISISVTSQRIYPYGTLACHALGYIGKMQSGNSVETYLSKGYAMDDMVGLDGIEKSMEDWLTPNSSVRQGQRVVEVNRSGSIVREMSYTGPQNGNNIKLTIRSDLQRVAEKALADVIREIRNIEERTMQNSGWLEKNKKELLDRDLEADPIKLADRGAIVVLDMQARVLALVSSPNYDPNLFILGMDPDQQQRMLLDKRNPLFNNAIGARDTPGSVFKMATALAALTDGALKPMDTINDEGLFTKYDVVNPPKCWASNAVRLAKHQNQTVVEGLQNSCNYF